MLAHWWSWLLRGWHAINWHDPSWVGAIGQLAAAGATFLAVGAALWLPRRERKRAEAERLRQRREQQLDNARLVTISIPTHHPSRCIEIVNNSELPMHYPRIDSVSDSRVRWEPNPDVSIFDQWQPTNYSDVLPSKAPHQVGYNYYSPDGRALTGRIENLITTDDVIITFMDNEGQFWRRTGSGEPVRISKPTG